MQTPSAPSLENAFHIAMVILILVLILILILGWLVMLFNLDKLCYEVEHWSYSVQFSRFLFCNLFWSISADPEKQSCIAFELLFSAYASIKVHPLTGELCQFLHVNSSVLQCHSMLLLLCSAPVPCEATLLLKCGLKMVNELYVTPTGDLCG